MSDQRGYDRKSAAKAYSVSVDTIQKAINSGALKAKRSGVDVNGDPVGKYIISREALEAWFDGLVDA